jgi:hypothetical protein
MASYQVGASARIGTLAARASTADGTGTAGRPTGNGDRPAGLQHAVAPGTGSALCGVPREQLHIFDELEFPHQWERSCTACLRAMARTRAS